jgi:hypothetical protein
MSRKKIGRNKMPSSSTETFVAALKQIPQPTPSPSQAVAIVGDYMQVLAKGIVQGAHVIDSATLPHPKLEIFNAATLLISLSRDAAEKATLATAARSLAFFQPNLGGTQAPLNDAPSHGASWESIVKAEMQSIDVVLPPALLQQK